MTIVFIGLLAFILGAIFIVNAVFLERYYISNKTDDLVETYQFLNDTIGGQELDEDTSEYSTVLREMGAMTERMNLDILIIDRNGNPFLGTIKNEDPRFFSTFRSVYYGDENSTVIESNEDYEISRTADTKSSTIAASIHATLMPKKGFDATFWRMTAPERQPSVRKMK